MHHDDFFSGGAHAVTGSLDSVSLGPHDTTAAHYAVPDLTGDQPYSSPFAAHDLIPTGEHQQALSTATPGPGGPEAAVSDVGHTIATSVTTIRFDHSNVNLSGGEQTTVHPPPASSQHGFWSEAANVGWFAPAFVWPLLGGAGRYMRKRLSAQTADDLAERLDAGERVVANVDVDELERNSGRGDQLSRVSRIPGQGTEAQVEVVAIDRAQPGGPVVVLEKGDGVVAKRVVPLEVFEAAWRLTGRHGYVLTQPASAPVTSADGPATTASSS